MNSTEIELVFIFTVRWGYHLLVSTFQAGELLFNGAGNYQVASKPVRTADSQNMAACCVTFNKHYLRSL